MTFEEIKELHGMGFTPEQIISLTGKPEQPQAEPEEQPEDTEPAEQPAEAEQPQPQEDTRITELQQEVENLKRQFQKQNRQTARMETLPDDLQTQTDKIMAELIRPTIKEENKP